MKWYKRSHNIDSLEALSANAVQSSTFRDMSRGPCRTTAFKDLATESADHQTGGEAAASYLYLKSASREVIDKNQDGCCRTPC